MTPEERLAALEARLGIATVAATTSRSAYALGVSFEEFCQSRDIEDDYGIEPLFDPLCASSYAHIGRLLRGLAKNGVQTDPPALESFLAYVKAHPKGEAGLNQQRRAFARLMDYHGQPVPRKMRRRWDTKAAVESALRHGAPIKKRERFFRDPVADVVKLVHASPFKRRWDDDAKPCPSAQLKNQVFRHAVLLSCMTGPRGGEAHALKVSNVDVGGRVVKGWWQQKKSYGRRVLVPEAWLFNQHTGPTVDHYLKFVRPKLDPRGEQESYFLTSQGKPFASDAAWRNFLGDGIRRTLGYSIGPHAFRRWCATMRRVYGWQVHEIAALLDDTDKVVEENYIDRRFVNANGTRRRTGDEKPALPPLWRLSEFT